MRISQRTMYLDHVNHMNNTLAAYMESNMQGASQKQINRPSDDPAGMARILMYRSSLSDISQFQRNLITAEGWLQETDHTLTLGDSGVSSVISLIREKAEQGATGIMSPENRLQIARQVRELFGTLINLSNQRYEGKSIFCGQNYNSTAYQEGLAADCGDADFQADLAFWRDVAPPNQPQWITFSNNTLNDQTAVIRFDTAGRVGVDPLDYRYTKDGGETWVTGTLTPPDREIDLGGTVMTIPANVRIPVFDETNTAATQIVVRPTAVYQGADNNAVPQIIFKTQPPYGVTASTTGTFATDIQVRFDTGVLNWGIPSNEDFAYSYSTDGGLTWTQRTGNTNDPRLVVPGGFVSIGPFNPLGGPSFQMMAGAELTIKPQRTDLPMQAESDYLTLANNVGKDVFGGVYMTTDALGRKVQATAFDGAGMNLFETVGKLIGALETNNQDGIQQALDDLTAAEKHVLAYAARIGARRNAVAVAKESLTTTKNSQQEAMSTIEDIDLTTLLTKLTQQQLAYSTVLKSSSMIMQLNLTQYI